MSASGSLIRRQRGLRLDHQRAGRQGIGRSKGAPARVVERARIVLLAADGLVDGGLGGILLTQTALTDYVRDYDAIEDARPQCWSGALTCRTGTLRRPPGRREHRRRRDRQQDPWSSDAGRPG
jgi:hypothetical protein